MPLYEYACKKCSRTFEALVFNGESVSCPECESEKIERLLSVPAEPPSESASLPTSCNSNLPPCGPRCCRI